MTYDFLVDPLHLTLILHARAAELLLRSGEALVDVVVFLAGLVGVGIHSANKTCQSHVRLLSYKRDTGLETYGIDLVWLLTERMVWLFVA